MQYRAMKDKPFDGIFRAMTKMMLFAILFWHLTNSVISFLETLLGVYGIAGNAMNPAGIVKKAGQMGMKAAGAAASAGLSAAGALKDMVSGGKQPRN